MRLNQRSSKLISFYYSARVGLDRSLYWWPSNVQYRACEDAVSKSFHLITLLKLLKSTRISNFQDFYPNAKLTQPHFTKYQNAHLYDTYSPYYFEGDPDSEFNLEPFLFPIPMPPLRIILLGEDKFPSREKWNGPIGSQKFGIHGSKLETCTAEYIVFQGIIPSPMQRVHVPD